MQHDNVGMHRNRLVNGQKWECEWVIDGRAAMSIGTQTSKTEPALDVPKKQDLCALRTYCMFGLRLSHMSCDEVELEKIIKLWFHYDQLALPLVSYMSRNLPSSSLWLVSPCLQHAMFPSSPTCSSLSCPPASEPSVMCHVSKLTNGLLPLPPLLLVSPHLQHATFLSSPTHIRKNLNC